MTTTVQLSTTKHVWNKSASKYDAIPVHGTIRLDINIEKIIEALGEKALLNKSGRAVQLRGLIKATRIAKR